MITCVRSFYFLPHNIKSLFSCIGVLVLSSFLSFHQDLLVSLKNLTVTLEDSLVLRVLLLAGCDPLDDPALLTTDENQYDTRRMLAAATSVNATR